MYARLVRALTDKTLRRTTTLVALAVVGGAIACSDAMGPARNFDSRFAKASSTGPTVTAANPSYSQPNVTLDVVVTGSGFEPGSTAKWLLNGVEDPRVVTNSTTVSSSTSLTANITISADAHSNLYDVAVITPLGKKGIGTEKFTVTPIVDSSVVAMDLSNGLTGGGARSISSTGIILGRIGSVRVWWQAGSPSVTVIDSGYVQGANRNADAGGSQNTVLLSTNGGPPWSQVALRPPPGFNAGATIARDLNDSRVVVGSTLGTVKALRWDNPTAAPVILPLPALQYPAVQSTARSINNSGVIVGYAYEGDVRTQGGSYTMYEAIVWKDGIPTVLPRAPGVRSQLASNINDAGVISGIADGVHPSRWTPRVDGGYDVAVANLNVGSTNLDTGIDACGRVTGGSDYGAWVWDGASDPILLPALLGPGYFGNALDISESGTIVGSSMSGVVKGSRIIKATAWSGLPPCTP